MIDQNIQTKNQKNANSKTNTQYIKITNMKSFSKKESIEDLRMHHMIEQNNKQSRKICQYENHPYQTHYNNPKNIV